MEPVVLLKTALDGDWRYTTTAPGEGWQSPGFDDADWRPMRPAPPPVSPGGQVPWMVRRLSRDGVKVLGVPGAPAALWIRCRFTLDMP